MQAGFLRLFARRERDEKEELPLEFSLRILLNPRMLSCSLNLLQCQFDGAASVAALLRSVKDAGWVVGEQIFLHTHKGQRGCSLSGDSETLEIPATKEARAERRWSLALLLSLIFSFFLFWGCRERPDFFLLRALPAADCDTELPLRSSVLSSELSRRSLAYPGPTEINLAWSVRNRGCPGPARFGSRKRDGDRFL